MGQRVASLEILFEMATGQAIADVVRFGGVVDKTMQGAITAANQADAAIKGMDGATTAAAATVRSAAEIRREYNNVEKAGESMARQIEREIAVFGKSASELRVLKAELAAVAAEQRGMTELAGRLRMVSGALQEMERGHTSLTPALMRSGMATRQFAVQLPDIAQGLLTGQHAMTVFIQQGGQLVQMAMMGEGGIRGFAKEIGLLALRFSPLLIAAAAAYGALRLVTSSLEDDAGLKKYAEGLGLTHKEMAKLGDVGVTIGDVITGVWRTLNADNTLGSYVAKAKALFGDMRDFVVGAMRTTGAVIYGAWVGAYRATIAAWDQLPAALGDLTIQAVNRAIDGINWLARGVNKLLGKDVLGQLTQLENPYAGAGRKLGETYSKAFMDAYKEGYAGLGTVGQNIIQAAKDRLKTQADEITFDKRAAAAAREHAKELRELAKAAKEAAEVRERLAADQIYQRGAAAKAMQDKYGQPVDLKLTGLKDDLKEISNWIEQHGFGAQMANQAKIASAAWDDLAQRVDTTADHMEKAFGRVGGSIGEAMQVLADYGREQARIDKAKEAAGNDQQTIDSLNQRSATNQLNAMLGLTSAARGLFREHSAGAKAMLAAERVLTAATLARTVIDVAAGAARMFSISGPLAFPQVAGMLAVMAGLGFAASTGGSGKAPTTNTGGGTVFGGGTDAKSESIQRSLDLLNDVDAQHLQYASQMAASLRSIESQIGNFATLLVRSGGINADSKVAQGFETNGIGKVAGAIVDPLGILSSLPILGDVVGAIKGVLKGLFGTKTSVIASGLSGGPQSLDSILGGGFDASYFSDVERRKKFLGLTASKKYSTVYSDADGGVEAQFGLILTQFYKTIAATAAPLGQATDAVTERLKATVIDIGRIDLKDLSGEEIQKKLEAVFGAQADMLAKAAFPDIEKFQAIGEGAFETLTRVAASVETVTQSMKTLGLSAQSLGLDISMAIVDQFESASDYASAVGQYFAAFYSETEIAAAKTAQLTDALSGYGLTLPSSIADYRKLVEAQDLSSQAGQEAYAVLLRLGPAFADLQKAAGDVVQGSANAAAILREREGLEQRLLEMSGDTVAIRATELAKLDPSNRALQERIYALTDEAAATQAATQAAEQAAQAELQRVTAVASERDGLERQWLQLTGETAALRVLDLAKLDASNQALQLRIWALQDEAVANDAATAASQAAAAASEQAAQAEAQRVAAIAQERMGLEQQLLQLQGNTAALRQMELDRLDDSNRSLQQQIYALQDAKEAAAAADELRKAWQSVGDTIMDEVKRIRGLGNTAGATGYGALLGQFNAANTGARAGDQDLAKGLPGLSKALLDAAAEVATSRQELDRIQAMTAASLEETYGLITSATMASAAATAGFTGGGSTGIEAASWWSAFAGGGSTANDNGDLAAELRALRAEVAGMRDDNNRGHAATAGNTGRIDRTLTNVTADGGDALQVRDAA